MLGPPPPPTSWTGEGSRFWAQSATEHVTVATGFASDLSLAPASALEYTPFDEPQTAPQHDMSSTIETISLDAETLPQDWANIQTVMMRNLPNKYTQEMLLEELDKAGFKGDYDFLYLPIDLDTTANKGYAFINFADPARAWMFKTVFEGRKMQKSNSNKQVMVSPAALQGFEANSAHYTDSRSSRADPTARPIFFRDVPPAQTPEVEVPARRRRRRGGRSSLIDVAARERASQNQKQAAAAIPAQVAPSMMQVAQQGFADAGLASAAAAAAGVSGSHLLTSHPRFCPFCGGSASASFRFCRFCGSPLPVAG